MAPAAATPEAQAQLVSNLWCQLLQLWPLQELAHAAHDEVACLPEAGYGGRHGVGSGQERRSPLSRLTMEREGAQQLLLPADSKYKPVCLQTKLRQGGQAGQAGQAGQG